MVLAAVCDYADFDGRQVRIEPCEVEGIPAGIGWHSVEWQTDYRHPTVKVGRTVRREGKAYTVPPRRRRAMSVAYAAELQRTHSLSSLPTCPIKSIEPYTSISKSIVLCM